MHRNHKWTKRQDDFGCRASVHKLACATITGLMFFAAAAPYSTGASVRFKLPEHFAEKSNLGMRKVAKLYSKSTCTIRFDEQFRYQVDVGYVIARHKALELAMAVDDDCMELGIDCRQREWPRGVMIGDRRSFGSIPRSTTVKSF